MQPSDHTSISKDELQDLARLLATLPSEQAMSLATLDGFFAALIAGPALVLPSEYLPVVCGVSDEDGLVELTTDVWFDFLNLGYRIAPAADTNEAMMPSPVCFISRPPNADNASRTIVSRTLSDFTPMMLRDRTFSNATM